MDIQNNKMDIDKKKVDIEDILFGRSKVMQLLGLKSSATSKLFSNLLQLEIIEPVAKQGKGKYKFKSYE